MSTRKWFILAAGGIGLVLLGMGLMLLVMFGLFSGWEGRVGASSLLPLYTMEQSASAHAGYRHNSVTSGGDVFVNDYEESGLQLTNPEPQTVIGHLGPMGVINVCSIPGQPVTAYIACDCGSEMPDFVPYRNIKQKPFEWRTATFCGMTFHRPKASSSDLTTTDGALLADVVHNLRDGVSVELPDFPFAGMADLASIKMTSNELPGLQFCPFVFTDAKGQIYLAESLMLDETATPTQLHARWVPASPKVAQWLKTP